MPLTTGSSSETLCNLAEVLKARKNKRLVKIFFNFIKDNAVLYNSINCPRERLTLYHYCDFESFLEIISKRTIKFNRIDKVNDKKENEVFGNLEIAKLVFISCFSINKEESGVWIKIV